MSTQRKANRQANVELFVIKEDDETKLASATLADDSELTFDVVAGGVYRFEVYAMFEVSSALSLGFDLTFTAPAGTVGGFAIAGPDGTQPYRYAQMSSFGSESENTNDYTGGAIFSYYGHAAPVVDGAVTLQWGAEDAVGTVTVKKGSYLIIRRLV